MRKQVNKNVNKHVNMQTFIQMGRLSTGEGVGLDLSAPSHVAIQGMTRSGKTAGTYSLLARLASLSPAVVLDVVDPTTVLGAPLVASGVAGSACLGTEEPRRAVEVVEGLLDVMRERVAGLWADRVDKRTTWSADYPLRVLVVEELPGVVQWLTDDDGANGRKPGERLAPKFLACLRQLLAQGLKVGVLVVLVAQRFDVTTLPGQARSNVSIRTCLRVDDSEAVAMLFPGAGSELVETLASVPPGRGVVTVPGHRAAGVALDYLDYSGYLDALGVSGDEVP